MSEGTGGQEQLKVVARCFNHAGDALGIAKELHEAGRFGFALHLALIAIEEVGKGQLLLLGDSSLRAEPNERTHEGAMDDHVQKLFWAFWVQFGLSPLTLGKHAGTPREIAKSLEEELGKTRQLAETLHELRLAALYVDSSPEAPAPSEVVGKERSEWVISLAETCVERAKRMSLENVEPDALEDLRWFSIAARDPSRKGLIWTKPSLAKCAELGIRGWLHWLREREQEELAAGAELARREIERKRPAEDVSMTPKWSMRVRLQSASHTYSNRAGREWNERNSWLRLMKVDNKPRCFDLEIRMPAALHVSHVFQAGFEYARAVAASLSVGAIGFFWFEQPRFDEKYYDALQDLESKARVDLKRAKRLAVDWYKGPLDEHMVQRALTCLALFLEGRETALEPALGHYLQGLTLMGKSDMLLRLEANAFDEFFVALMEGLKFTGAWDGSGDGRQAFELHASKALHDAGDRDRYFKAGERLRKQEQPGMVITLEEVAGMKVLADLMFVEHANAWAAEQLGKKPGEGPDPIESQP